MGGKILVHQKKFHEIDLFLISQKFREISRNFCEIQE